MLEFLTENTGVNTDDLRLDSGCLVTNSPVTKEKIDKMNFIKIKNFCALNSVKKIKRQPRE